MEEKTAIAAAGTLALLGLAAGLSVAARYPAEWALLMGASGVGFGLLSSLVYSRRLMFVAAASPHAAFLAASLALILSGWLGGPVEAYTLAVGLLAVYSVGFLVYKGVDPDEATSLMVSATSALGALAMYMAVQRYPSARIASIVIGDPLLASRADLYTALAASGLILAIALLAAREIYYAGVDPEDARLSGVRLWLYDAALYTVIGLAAVGMVRVVGFVMEHVLILLPGAIAAAAARGVYPSLLLSGALGLFAGLSGLLLAVTLDVAPSPAAGLILVAAYLVVRLWGWLQGG